MEFKDYKSAHQNCSLCRLVSEFEQAGPLNLSHVAVDRGSVYLAGANVLYQLDPSLRPQHTVHTGPLLDSHQCGAKGCSSTNQANTSLVSTNNYNKVNNTY